MKLMFLRETHCLQVDANTHEPLMSIKTENQMKFAKVFKDICIQCCQSGVCPSVEKNETSWTIIFNEDQRRKLFTVFDVILGNTGGDLERLQKWQTFCETCPPIQKIQKNKRKNLKRQNTNTTSSPKKKPKFDLYCRLKELPPDPNEYQQGALWHVQFEEQHKTWKSYRIALPLQSPRGLLEFSSGSERCNLF